MQHTKQYKGYHLATTGNGQDGKPRWRLKQYLGYDKNGKKIALHKIVESEDVCKNEVRNEWWKQQLLKVYEGNDTHIAS